MKRNLLLLSIFSVIHITVIAQKISPDIRLNQIGFYPSAPKIAVITKEVKGIFYIVAADTKEKVYTDTLSTPRQSEFSTKKTCIADFTAFTKTGTYIVSIPNVGESYSFEIKQAVHNEVAKAVIKGFYYQRVSAPLTEEYSGQWKRPAGHPDNKVLVHASAATSKRKTGTVISSPKGWYDAGDYNKYIVNSGITMGTLFSAYEDFPQHFKNQNLNIPESANNIPDILDEALWNLRWMLTMQDDDGGVYHKLTNVKFDAFIMPDKAVTPRYVVEKGTAATLDFAAVMAQAARIFKSYNKELPGLSDSCLAASKKAWEWAQKNSATEYNQTAMNKAFDPDISTGAYGDKTFTDELAWATCELFITTKDNSYYKFLPAVATAGKMVLPSWSQVKLLGYYTLIRFEKNAPSSVSGDLLEIKKQFIDFVDELIANTDARSYNTVIGKSAGDFIWGSNAVAANQSVALIQAYKITGNKSYLSYALTNLDYILGRNGTGYSFITGAGDHPPMHPHHRPSEADGIKDPIPGLLVGGPNPGMQDKCKYTSRVANEAYADDVCSYASNEIAINWNAPIVYVINAIEALQNKIDFTGRQ